MSAFDLTKTDSATFSIASGASIEGISLNGLAEYLANSNTGPAAANLIGSRIQEATPGRF